MLKGKRSTGIEYADVTSPQRDLAPRLIDTAFAVPLKVEIEALTRRPGDFAPRAHDKMRRGVDAVDRTLPQRQRLHGCIEPAAALGFEVGKQFHERLADAFAIIVEGFVRIDVARVPHAAPAQRWQRTRSHFLHGHLLHPMVRASPA